MTYDSIEPIEPDAAPATPPPPKILHRRAAAGELSARRRDQLKFAVYGLSENL
jgi:hypothetical protein